MARSLRFDMINVHELRQIVRGLKNKKDVVNDGIPSEIYKFASERLLTLMSIFLSSCMLPAKLPSPLMHRVYNTTKTLYAGPTKSITGSVLNKRQARK